MGFLDKPKGEDAKKPAAQLHKETEERRAAGIKIDRAEMNRIRDYLQKKNDN